MSIENARIQVAKGVALLDEKVPGWWRVIDLDHLQMQNCTQCMLGQLFGHNVETALGTEMFGLPIDPSLLGRSWSYYTASGRELEAGYQRGLNALLGVTRITAGAVIGCATDGSDRCYYSYDDLKCAWAEVIADRRAAEQADVPPPTTTQTGEDNADRSL